MNINTKILRERETVPCRVCKMPTPMLSTKLCDRCWELERRIEKDPEIARQILDDVERKLNA